MDKSVSTHETTPSPLFKQRLRARSRSPRTLYLNSRMVTPMSEHMGYDTFMKGNCTYNEALKVPNLASIATSQENS